MDAELKAALIGAIVATLASALFLYLYETYKDRRLRGRIASALLVEVIAQTAEFASVARGPHNAPSMPEFHSAEYVADLVERQSQGLIERLKSAASGAAFNAILAIKALDEIAPHIRLPNDETIVADVLRKLEKAAGRRAAPTS